ncbi:MAG: ABC transporter ATP-binding protein, partial [Gammaproteobacteria bacterium]
MSSVLELIEASVAIEDHVIVHDMSFELHEGDIGCLLGPSGCGKTTLLRGIAGLERTVSGEIRIQDEIVAGERVHIAVEQRRVGMMFQDFALFPHLTVRDNIAFGLNRMPAHERNHRIHELAEMLEITGFLNYYPHQISGGQQQRVALARAMAPRPRILLMDEPFASMDVELREQIAREVRTVLKEDGITAILVSHNQYEAFAMADVIGV